MREECKKDFKRLSEYLDGELDEEVCREIEQHFRHCPECRACVESMRKTIQLCKEAATVEVPVDARERLRSMLRECFSRNHAI
jgi:anti-sigma factor RsiW